jgi:[ribosomal protein S5]-alanine N-acetyltransferase
MTPVLLTDALLLRPFEHEDARAFAAVMNHPSVAYGVCAEPLPFTELHASARILMIRAAEMQGKDLAWAIESQEGDLIGMIALRSGRAGISDLGFAIAPQWQGQGHASAALGVVLDWLKINRPGLRLQVEVFTDQPAGLSVLHRAGFIEAGERTRFSIARERSDKAIRFVHPVFGGRPMPAAA